MYRKLEDKSNIGTWITLLVVCVFAFFINVSSLLPEIMESRNIITAREMVYDGNWLVPTMNGELRLEKPPLPTWITAAAEIISPDNLGLERSMAGLAGVIMVIAFYLLGTLFFKNKQTSLISTIILCTCYSVIIMGRTASWDIYTHGFMLMGIYFLVKALQSIDKAEWLNFSLAGLFIGLSILSKGPVSLFAVLLPFILTYCWFYPSKMQNKWGAFLLMILIAVVVGCWWYAFIFLFHSEEMASVAAKETAAWAGHNVRPWYYYWKFFLESGIWSLLLLTAIFTPLWSWREKNRREYLFPLFWMLLTVVLLSLMPEKKTRYLFPVMISASYTMGYLIMAWDGRLRTRKTSTADKLMFRLNSSLLTIIILAFPIALYFTAYKHGYTSLAVQIAMSVICLVIFIIAAKSTKEWRPIGVVVSVLLLFMSIELLLMPSVKYLFNNIDQHSIELTRDLECLDGIQFYHNAEEELRIEEVYAAHRTIKPLNFKNIDELKAALPFAVMTHTDVYSELPKEFLDSVKVTFIDRYDDNNHKKGRSKYRPIFIYDLNLIEALPKNY